MNNLKNKYNLKIMWQPSTRFISGQSKDKVRFIAEQIDVFSLTRKQALDLTDCITLEDAINQLKKWKTDLIYLQDEAFGVHLIQNNNWAMNRSTTIASDIPMQRN